MSVEDEDRARPLSVIPKEEIQRGSTLDLDGRGSEMSRQSLSIIRQHRIAIS